MSMREKHAPDSIAPPGKFIQAGDVKIFTMQEGAQDGPRVLLIHGTGAWGELWRPVIDSLASAGFNVLTIDIPPFGFSEKIRGAENFSVRKQGDRLLAALEALGIDQTAIVCHSVGCRTAIEAVLKKPDMFSKIVLADPALGLLREGEILRFEQKNPGSLAKSFLSAGIFRDMASSVYGTSPWSIRPLFSSFVTDKSSVTDQRVAVLQKPLALKGMTTAQGDWLQNLVTTPEYGLFIDFASYKSIAAPMLIVWGREDSITPLWQGEELAKLSGADLSVIDGAGHIPYIERSEEFNDILVTFLK